MKKILLITILMISQSFVFAQSEKISLLSPKNLTASITAKPVQKSKTSFLLKDYPAGVRKVMDTMPVEDVPFKKSVQIGSIIHMVGSVSQAQTSAVQDADPTFSNEWRRSFNMYRVRLLFGAQLSKKGSVFLETDIPTIIGSGPTGTKNIKVSPIILDAQYEHDFLPQFNVIVGQQLVSHNRNGLQRAAALMANDFTHYQYPYNLFESDPLQGNFGRDLGVNTRGFFLKDKLEYRLGAFTGRKFDGKGPMRVVGRLAYNFLDAEKDYYYAGTKLGTGKTFALAVGYDGQGSYSNIGADAFLDVPVGSGSITINTAFTAMTGGTSTGQYVFTTLIPKQTIQFLELGYFFKTIKLQPWIKYENQDIDGEAIQFGMPAGTTGAAIENMNILKSNKRMGGGINYFFNDYNANLRASYTDVKYGRANLSGGAETTNYGQLWLQLQIFIF